MVRTKEREVEWCREASKRGGSRWRAEHQGTSEEDWLERDGSIKGSGRSWACRDRVEQGNQGQTRRGPKSVRLLD